MLIVRFTHRFKKNYTKVERSGKDLSNVKTIVLELRKGNPIEKSFRDHPLKGNYKDCRECHLASDLLLIYYIKNDELILVNIGSHTELFE